MKGEWMIEVQLEWHGFFQSIECIPVKYAKRERKWDYDMAEAADGDWFYESSQRRVRLLYVEKFAVMKNKQRAEACA